jgi:streptomycin 6-kinase
VSSIRIPPLLASAVEADDDPARRPWLAALPELVDGIASDWGLEVGDPYLPGGQTAWVVPVRNPIGDELVLKVGWRHFEAEHEADGLRHWDGNGAVRCHAARSLDHTTALLLERCTPGRQLRRSLPEAGQDVIIAGLLRRLWERALRDDHPFSPLAEMCRHWADSLERALEAGARGLDTGLAREAVALLRTLPVTADRAVLLCTDLHAENVLSARREPWLVIDPKPYVGDPSYDPVQYMLNCDERLTADPLGLVRRMAELLGLDPERVALWLFARCAQESLRDPTMREPARRLAP